MPAELTDYDLVVIGGTAGGLSAAISTLRSGIGLVRVVESGHSVAFPEMVGPDQLDVGYGESVVEIDAAGESVLVTTDKHAYRTKACLVANRRPLPGWKPPVEIYPSGRIHIDARPEHIENSDVLVVGYTDHAVECSAEAVQAGARVVLAAGGMDTDRLSPAGAEMLRRLEHERRATILYESTPHQIVDSGGYPMVFFDDRRMPDLQFDHVLFASHRETLAPSDVNMTGQGVQTRRVWFLGEPAESDVAPTAPGWRIGAEIIESCFPETSPIVETFDEVGKRDQAAIAKLRSENYNATITHFEPAHSDLWVLRVRPDFGGSAFDPGQYASLGLGYWEPRIDDAEDPSLDDRWTKLIRRSYSISSRMLDDVGYLSDDRAGHELEFYIVKVPATPERVPGLTPRLALKRPGDRIYLGPKVAGRYTLAPVTDPASIVVFLATGTGEAPHNSMVIELLRKGHYGPIVSVVSVRYWDDLGYLDEHQDLAQRYANYYYIPVPTREADIPKRYVQDVIRDGDLERLGIVLDPTATNVFLCGNPAMIGIPNEDVFPEPTGVVEILTEMGLTLDRRHQPGNIHVEEYW